MCPVNDWKAEMKKETYIDLKVSLLDLRIGRGSPDADKIHFNRDECESNELFLLIDFRSLFDYESLSKHFPLFLLFEDILYFQGRV
jgi:hypothetical protein